MSMYRTVTITAEITDSIIEVAPAVSPAAVSVTAELFTDVISSEAEHYTGAYTFTPSTETQTIDIGGMIATGDITINPIPSNYGLITWNGNTLTVS